MCLYFEETGSQIIDVGGERGGGRGGKGRVGLDSVDASIGRERDREREAVNFVQLSKISVITFYFILFFAGERREGGGERKHFQVVIVSLLCNSLLY